MNATEKEQKETEEGLRYFKTTLNDGRKVYTYKYTTRDEMLSDYSTLKDICPDAEFKVYYVIEEELTWVYS